MEAWKQVEDSVKCGDSDVRLMGTGEQRISLDGVRVELREWVEYHVRAADNAKLVVYQGREPIKPLSPGVWRVVYQNYIGLGVLRFELDGRPLPPLPVEVCSNKFPSLIEQRKFYDDLLDDLWRRNNRLPFAFAAPTFHAVEEAPQPPSPLFVYHFMQSHAEQLSAALETVLGAPHRALCEDEALLPLPQVSTVDADVINWIITHPEHWVRAPHLAVARRLDGYAPARVWQRLADETFDTPPNRFVRNFVRELQGWFAHPTLARYARRLTAARGAVETALHDPLFDEVGEMRRFPAESQVLLKRDGYRELLALWRLFHLARRPFFGPLETAIYSRDVATLYEFWCFFALLEQVGAILEVKPRLDLKLHEEHGLRWTTKATFPGTNWELIFNKSFRRPNDSYSLGLRPDFALTGAGGLLIFDAKFRFNERDVDLMVAEDAEQVLEDAVRQGNVERVAKQADLYKMHTYRDALQARAAVALYPGDRAEFFDLEQGQRRDVTLANLLRDDGWQGVGALPLRPSV